METKHCKCCNTTKSVDEFYWQRGRPSHPCKECKKAKQRERNDPEKTRRWDLKKKFGITPEEYDVMFAEQNGGCKICGETTMSNGKSNLAVDHDHGTRKIRGLLCNNCNLMLGHAKDNIQTLQNAINYLNKYD